jgi:hypothetical protein
MKFLERTGKETLDKVEKARVTECLSKYGV